jgi:hypothetical protein
MYEHVALVLSCTCDRIEGNVDRVLSVGLFQFDCRYLRGLISANYLREIGGRSGTIGG